MKSIAVIGLGRFGISIAETLCMLGHEVMAIDTSEEKVAEIEDSVTHALQADCTEKNTLKELGLRNFDIVVVAIGEDLETSMMITLLCKELGCKYVLVKASNELHSRILYKIGADKVIIPERDMGVRAAHNLASASVMDFIELSPEYSLVEIKAVPEWIGKDLKDLNVRAKYGITVMAIKHGGDINVSPLATDTIFEGDILVVIGHIENIAKLENKHGGV